MLGVTQESGDLLLPLGILGLERLAVGCLETKNETWEKQTGDLFDIVSDKTTTVNII